jgi:tetratricopeptide (TPR) repeat protein
VTAPWPVWRAAEEPAELARYVQYGRVARLLGSSSGLPGRSGATRLDRLGTLAGLFRERRVAYADEPIAEGGQIIRPPDEVLVTPRQATCVDLAVTFAGACLDAGLTPVVVVADPVAAGAAAHAIVVVWLGGDWPETPLTGASWQRMPELLDGNLITAAATPGDFAALDVAQLAGRHDSGPVTLDDLLAAGAAILTSGDWTWRTGVNVAAGFDASRSHPFTEINRDPVAEPYLAAPAEESPLAQITGRRDVVPFVARDEYEILLDWCRAPGRPGLGVAVLHGEGGAGKTRTAAELCRVLAGENWYTGFLADGLTAPELEWLGRTVSPLLLVVDYAEYRTATVVDLARAVQRRPGPVRLLLTCRAVGNWLTSDVIAVLNREAVTPAIRPPLVLVGCHPRPGGVYRRALSAFRRTLPPGEPGPQTAAGPAGDAPAFDDRWTTLDVIMLAWLAARRSSSLPTGEDELHAEVLRHETRYWRAETVRRYGVTYDQPDDVWTDLAAAVSLLGPGSGRLPEIAGCVDGLDGPAESGARRRIADVLGRLLPAEPGHHGVELRPDPIADRVIRERLTDGPLLTRLITAATADELLHACQVVSRADAGPDLAGRILTARPGDVWEPALDTVTTVGGPFRVPLEELAGAPGTPLPLDRLAETIPFGHASLYGVARVAAERTIGELPAGSGTEQLLSYAEGLANLSIRRADAGDYRGALEASTASIDIIQPLAADDASLVPQLAGALLNHAADLDRAGDLWEAFRACRRAAELLTPLTHLVPALEADLARAFAGMGRLQSVLGDTDGALASATTAVRMYERLADEEPEHEMSLASAMLGLATAQFESGDLDAAVSTDAAAVVHYRRLAGEDPFRYADDLAMALSNLSIRLSATGRFDLAAQEAAEAVEIFAELCELNPAAHLDSLAAALTNLSECHLQAGAHDLARQAAEEAAAIMRDLDDAEPGLFRSELAAALNNVSLAAGSAGDVAGALAAATEAVGLQRDNDDQAGLARALDSLADWQYRAGDLATAVVTSREAVGCYRELDRIDPVRGPIRLAMSLSNLSVYLGAAGDLVPALLTAREAADTYAQMNGPPPPVVADHAKALTNLAILQSRTGDAPGALDSGRQAVDLLRAPAAGNPGGIRPQLASALSNLGAFQRDMGLVPEALASATEAAAIARELAAADPAAHRPGLCDALVNLANAQTDSGADRQAAATAEHAVQLRRTLADDGESRERLARALAVLTAKRYAVGETTGALAAAEEVVAIRRAGISSGTPEQLADLASALQSLAVVQSATGDPAAALASSREAAGTVRPLAGSDQPYQRALFVRVSAQLAADLSENGQVAEAITITEANVTTLRDIAAGSPELYLPELARVLNNLGTMLAQAGRHEPALTATAEAVDLYRALAGSHPGPHLEGLATTLNNLQDRMTSLGRTADGAAVFDAAIGDLPAGIAAELLLRRGYLAFVVGRGDRGVDDLRRAAITVDREADPTWLGRVRRNVRKLAEELGAPGGPGLPALPGWVTADPGRVHELYNAYASAATWPEQRAALLLHRDLATPRGLGQLATARLIFPDLPVVGDLQDFYTAAAAGSVEEELELLDRSVATADAVRDWIAAPTWTAAQEVTERHPELLTDPAVGPILENLLGDPVDARPYLGIILLARRMPLADVYDLYADDDLAEAAVLAAVGDGDFDLLRELLAGLTTSLMRSPFVMNYVAAVLQVFEDEPGPPGSPLNPETLIGEAAAAGTPAQLEAGAVRLRRLASARPAHADRLRGLNTALTPPAG